MGQKKEDTPVNGSVAEDIIGLWVVLGRYFPFYEREIIDIDFPTVGKLTLWRFDSDGTAVYDGDFLTFAYYQYYTEHNRIYLSSESGGCAQIYRAEIHGDRATLYRQEQVESDRMSDTVRIEIMRYKNSIDYWKEIADEHRRAIDKGAIEVNCELTLKILEKLTFLKDNEGV